MQEMNIDSIGRIVIPANIRNDMKLTDKIYYEYNDKSKVLKFYGENTQEIVNFITKRYNSNISKREKSFLTKLLGYYN